MKQVIFALLSFSIILSGLSAGGKQESEPVDPGTASGEGRTIKISYDIQKNDEGSRSEGRSHILSINGYTLPDVFSLVYAADNQYDFRVKTQTWGDGGYVLDRNKKGTPPYTETESSIADRDWELGWYEGTRRKKGTPRSWVYVESESLKAFVNPDELDRFIEYEQLEPMARDKLHTVLPE